METTPVLTHPVAPDRDRADRDRMRLSNLSIEDRRAIVAELIAKGYALSPRSMAEAFGVSKSMVKRAIGRGALPAFRLGQEHRIRPEHIPVELLDGWAVGEGTDKWPDGEIVYFLHGAEGFVKIGFTSNMVNRAKDLQIGCPEALQLLAFAPGGRDVERAYHRLFAKHRAQGEWFRRDADIDAEIERLNHKDTHHAV